MDQFKQAVNLARGPAPLAPNPEHDTIAQGARAPQPLNGAAQSKLRTLPLKPSHLESMRIVAHNKDDPRSRSFDMLRTQVLQSMDANGWQFLAITAPTPECGKTVTACNLALSIARLPDRSVVVVDLDMRKPKLAGYFGIKSEFGVLSVLQGHQHLSDAMVQVGIERERLLVLPGQQTRSSSEWMASPSMLALLDSMKREFRSHIIILDLPPLLVGDDVLSLLPHLQSVLLVAEAGRSSMPELKECTKHLKDTPVVRVVLNKVTEKEPATYDEYY